MGIPMARNVRQAGFTVSGWARGGRTAERAAGAGLEMRANPAELAGGCDAVITMVTTSSDVEEVVLGPNGVLAGARPGTVIVDMSTIAPATSRALGEAAAARGVDFLGAPVSGGSFGAEAGNLTIMVGGDAGVFQRCRPLFEAMGNPERVFHVGPWGSGEVVKLVNNMLAGAIAGATLEALLVGVRAGVGLQTLVDVVSVSSGGSTQLEGALKPRALRGDFTPGFFTDLLVKDIGLALDLAETVGQQAAFAELARRLFASSQAAGHGREDYSAVLLEMERGIDPPPRLG
ncbi:MAG: NAD(P)-dependent oxidoreductase [Candidatus Dormibacteraeota bacterium]|nr:NAD(P)-dependent oxidoreductase [Candidatus Dormibacteraeota bacterium]